MTSSREGYIMIDGASTYQAIPVSGVVSTGSPCRAAEEDDDGLIDVVQFTSNMYYVEEQEGKVTVDLMRLGHLEGEASVMYQTHNATADDVNDYVPTHGKVVFAAGEYIKSIDVELRPNDLYKTTKTFRIQLDSGTSCKLGKTLHSCRVKIIDQSTFPSDRFHEELTTGDLAKATKKLPPMALIFESFKLVYKCAGVRQSTILVLFMDQLANAYHLLLIYASVYLVNTVLSNTPEAEKNLLLPERRQNLYLIAGVYIVPMLVVHIWEYCKVILNLESRVAGFFRLTLFHTYLDCSADSRSKVDVGLMTLALHSDSDKIASGYMHMLAMVQALGKTGFAFYFVIAKAEEALCIVILVPALILLWLTIRQPMELKMPGASGRMVKVLEAICDTFDSYELLESFGRRDVAVESFRQLVIALQDGPVGKACFVLNSNYFLKWLSPIMISVYIITAGHAVLDGDVTLGAFLAVIKIIHEVCNDCQSIYREYGGIVKTIKSLMRLAFLLNLPSGLYGRKLSNRMRREETRTRRTSLDKRTDIPHGKYKYDMLPIELMHIEVQSKDSDMTGLGKNLLEGVNASCTQGSIVALYGHPACGKRTLLKLISLSDAPTKGKVFVPQHLRVVFVSDSVVLKQSAYRNLTFGLPHDLKPDHGRIRNILLKLNMAKILGFVNADLDKPPPDNPDEPHEDKDISWMDALTDTDCRLLSVARAFIANPEVLLLEKPFNHFGEVQERLIVESMSEFVQERGLCMRNPNDGKSRRPRTLIFSTGKENKTKYADEVWHLLPADGSKDDRRTAHCLKVVKNKKQE